jgi:hypothetical protein
MATFDDFDGVWFTIQALRIRMFHAEVADQLAFVIVDNHPEGPVAPDLKQLDEVEITSAGFGKRTDGTTRSRSPP